MRDEEARWHALPGAFGYEASDFSPRMTFHISRGLLQVGASAAHPRLHLK